MKGEQQELFTELPPVKARVYAIMNPETMRGYGIGLGLQGEALDFFTHFQEVALDISVDLCTGKVLTCEVAK